MSNEINEDLSEVSQNEDNSSEKYNEKIYYTDGYNTITSKRFALGVNTHVISNISRIYKGSVTHAGSQGVENTKRNMLIGGGIFGIIIGISLLMGGSFLVGLIFTGLGGFALKKGYEEEKIVGATSDTNEYLVEIINNAGELDRITSKDNNKIDKIMDAINKAITENL